MRCWASRRALAGTTSSLALTAVFALASTRRVPLSDHARLDIELGQGLLALGQLWTIPRLNSVLKIRRPSAFPGRSVAHTGPPSCASRIAPSVSGSIGEQSGSANGSGSCPVLGARPSPAPSSPSRHSRSWSYAGSCRPGIA
jgi:hypothetical protein